MTTLVHPDQTSSVNGRVIQDSLAHVMSVIHYANECNADALILSVDHQAAFDMLEWVFIFETFRAMNFGTNFIKMLKCIYKPGLTRSSVIVNGFQSDFFRVFRGIRQGCLLSPSLYVITAEVVAHYIRKTPNIAGVPLYGTNTRITKFADDTSVLLNRISDIENVFNIFDKFQSASGSRLKPSKTQLLLLGGLKNVVVPQKYALFRVDKLKLYGMWLSYALMASICQKTGQNATKQLQSWSEESHRAGFQS